MWTIVQHDGPNHLELWLNQVLLPTDTAGRVFELMLSIQPRWTKEKLVDQYPLVLLHSQAPHVIEHAKMHTEWMRDNCRLGAPCLAVAETVI